MRQALSLLGLVLLFEWASGRTLVTHLPGYHGRLPFHLETGYAGVDERQKVNLFYYFVKSARSPADDPLLLWITGGPGCSGLRGLTDQVGPFSVEYNTSDIGGPPILVSRKEAWTKISSIIFVDSPVGTGFSYSEDDDDEKDWSDTITTKYLHAFIRKWLADHSEFISNPLYVAGDSYGGKMVPVVAQEIITGIDEGLDPVLNFKGYIVGNPIVNDDGFGNQREVDYTYGMGIISDELYQRTKESCGGQYVPPRSVQCKQCLDDVRKNLVGVNAENILEPAIEYVCPKLEHSTGGRYLIGAAGKYRNRHDLPDEGCEELLRLPTKLWVDRDAAKEALGVRKAHAREWRTCHFYMGEKYTVDIPSSFPHHLYVTSRGFRSLVYSGDHDFAANFMGTQAWIRALNFSIVDDWHPWLVEGQVAGYTRTYANNLTFATVKGAGHVASYARPKECWALFERWISGMGI